MADGCLPGQTPWLTKFLRPCFAEELPSAAPSEEVAEHVISVRAGVQPRDINAPRRGPRGSTRRVAREPAMTPKLNGTSETFIGRRRPAMPIHGVSVAGEVAVGSPLLRGGWLRRVIDIVSQKEWQLQVSVRKRVLVHQSCG